MAITKVSESAFTIALGTGNQTQALPGTPLENDVVVFQRASDLALSTIPIVTAGYTSEVGPTATSGPGSELAWKRMGATPDADIVVPRLSSRVQACAIQIWRGIDVTTAIDVATQGAAGGSGMPDPPPITPVTVGALVLAGGFLDDDDAAASVTAPAGYSDLIASETTIGDPNGSTVMMASKVWASGAEDPAAFGGTGDDSWRSFSSAFRPGASGLTVEGRNLILSAMDMDTGRMDGIPEPGQLLARPALQNMLNSYAGFSWDPSTPPPAYSGGALAMGV